MKIVLVSPFSLEANNISGGVAAVSQFLAEALIVAGHEVHIVAPGKKEGETEHRGKFTIHWSGTHRLPGFLVYASQQRQRMFKIINSLKPDVVHFEGSFGWSIDCPWPYVVTIHGIAEKDAAFSNNLIKAFIASNMIRLTENRGRAKAKHVISISEYATGLLQEQLGGEIHHISNPIDKKLFDYKIPKEQRENKIVSVGIVGERKNTLGVIRAFAKLKMYSDNLTLKVCGHATSPEYLQSCKDEVSKLGIEKDVEFTGNLQRDVLYRHIASAKALLMMSKQETAPMAIAESMALGVPSIAPAEFGIPYMIDEGQNGWFVSEQTSDEKWKVIANTLDSENWDKMSDCAFETANRYNPDTVASETVDVYKAAIADSNDKLE